jgi:hypothetical protein
VRDSNRAAKDPGINYDSGSPFDRAMTRAQPKTTFGSPAPKGAEAKRLALAAALAKSRSQYTYSSGNIMAPRGRIVEA